MGSWVYSTSIKIEEVLLNMPLQIKKSIVQLSCLTLMQVLDPLCKYVIHCDNVR